MKKKSTPLATRQVRRTGRPFPGRQGRKHYFLRYVIQHGEQSYYGKAVTTTRRLDKLLQDITGEFDGTDAKDKDELQRALAALRAGDFVIFDCDERAVHRIDVTPLPPYAAKVLKRYLGCW